MPYRVLGLGLLGFIGCAQEPVTVADAGPSAVDASAYDAGPPPPLALRLEAAPATIDGRPWPSNHWRNDDGWRLPAVEDDEDFFHVTMYQIERRLDGFALRPVARLCFTQELPQIPPPAGLIRLLDTEQREQSIAQVTIDRERRCLQFAAASPLVPNATYYVVLNKVPGDWDVVLLEGATPSDDELAQRIAASEDVIAAEPFTVQSLGVDIAMRRQAIVDARAWEDGLPDVEVLRRTPISDLRQGNAFGIEAGRRGFYLRLHIADLVAAENDQLVLEEEPLLDMDRLSSTSAALVRAAASGEQRFATINRDWSLSVEIDAPAGTTVQVFQELFMPVQSYADIDGGLDSNILELIHAQAPLPKWRNHLGILESMTISGRPSGGAENLSFSVYIPRGDQPDNGWPVVFLGPGYAGLQHDMWVIADRLCAAGYAAVVIDAAGHGGGPATELQLPLVNALPADLQTPGRSIDSNADGRYGLPEGMHGSWAAPEFAGMVGMQDANRQTALDFMALMTLLLPDTDQGRFGADLDQDGRADFDSARVAYMGHSNGGRYGMTLAAHEPRLGRVVLMAPPGDGYIPYVSSYRETWADLFDTWLPPLSNDPSNRYGLFDEGVLWPGDGLLDAPRAFHGINRYTVRKAWLGGDAEGEGAAWLWRQSLAAGEQRASLMVQLIHGDPAVVNPDSMRLVDAAGDELTLATVNPDASEWREYMRYSDLLFRHLIPIYESRATTPPGALARLSREQAVAFIIGSTELDLDGDGAVLSLEPNRRDLRFLLGFSFWELRQLLRF